MKLGIVMSLAWFNENIRKVKTINTKQTEKYKEVLLKRNKNIIPEHLPSFAV